MVVDGNGNLISNYVYAGGSSPFMRLDGSGNPVYYLTDAMGSTIGLADGTGQSAAKFNYDSFGNLRSSSGAAANTGIAGGDFRFQGQWLEQGTGIYNFRARDYDAKTGMFLSRDPVEPLQYEPESFNPYQFVYHNPHVYSDPTGMITVTELNVSQVVQNILQGIENHAKLTIKEELKNEIQGVATDVLTSVLKSTVPGVDLAANTLFGNSLNSIPNPWEIAITDALCDVIRSAMPNFFGLDYLWLQTPINRDGNPSDDGLNPSSSGSGCGIPFIAGGSDVKPELIIKRGGPKSTDKNPPGHLVLEVKKQIDDITQGDRQLNAILKYAKPQNGHLYTPVAIYVSLEASKKSTRQGTNENKLMLHALRSGVFLRVIDFGF